MSDTKFNKFYYNGSTVYLYNALTRNGTLDEQYDRFSLYCPYCKEARLKFVSATSQKSAYLATWGGEEHSANCPAGYTPASKKELTDYYKSLSKEQIFDKLNACLRFLINKDSRSTSSEQSTQTKSKITHASSSSSVVKRNIPHRSAYTIPNIEEGLRHVPILFYGRVYIEFERHYSKNKIVLKRESTKEPFLYMNNGYSSENIPKDFDENVLYNIVFIARYNGRDRFPNLIDYGAFKISPVKLD